MPHLLSQSWFFIFLVLIKVLSKIITFPHFTEVDRKTFALSVHFLVYTIVYNAYFDTVIYTSMIWMSHTGARGSLVCTGIAFSVQTCPFKLALQNICVHAHLYRVSLPALYSLNMDITIVKLAPFFSQECTMGSGRSQPC